MPHAVAPLLVTILLLNLFVLGTSRLRAAIQASAAQGVVLGALTLLVHRDYGARTVAVAAGAAIVKGVVIPVMLNRAMREVVVRR